MCVHRRLRTSPRSMYRRVKSSRFLDQLPTWLRQERKHSKTQDRILSSVVRPQTWHPSSPPVKSACRIQVRVRLTFVKSAPSNVAVSNCPPNRSAPEILMPRRSAPLKHTRALTKIAMAFAAARLYPGSDFDCSTAVRSCCLKAGLCGTRL